VGMNSVEAIFLSFFSSYVSAKLFHIHSCHDEDSKFW
jgi:hypothetical protein